MTKKAIDFEVRNFLRNNFVFEQDDPFKFERMNTKIINLHVRKLVIREIFLTRKLKILPFEPLPNNHDPLKEIAAIVKGKIAARQAGITSV